MEGPPSKGREASPEEAGLGSPRDRAQAEAALSLSAQAGASYRYRAISRDVLAPWEGELDALFDFGALVSGQGRLFLVPPVISQAGPALRLDSPVSASSQEYSYSLVSPARLESRAPDWRAYLLSELPAARELHPSVFPVGRKERELWEKRVDLGWKAGLEQAEALFRANLARLERDYRGMLLFFRLSREDKVYGPSLRESRPREEIGHREAVYRRVLYRLMEGGRFKPPR
jgi:defect-in-organelle-trafficking protein DotC